VSSMPTRIGSVNMHHPGLCFLEQREMAVCPGRRDVPHMLRLPDEA
jgi:hypothetical protein